MSLQIELRNPERSFAPGDVIAGHANWEYVELPGDLTIALFFSSKGKATPQREIVDMKTWHDCAARSQQPFEFTASNWPWSFSGKLISLEWGIHAEFSAADEESEISIVVSPSGNEIDLYAYPLDDISP